MAKWLNLTQVVRLKGGNDDVDDCREEDPWAELKYFGAQVNSAETGSLGENSELESGVWDGGSW